MSVVVTAQVALQASELDEAALRRMLSVQPDYMAIQQFMFSEGFGGFGATSKVAKMGNRHVEVQDDTIFINEPGKPTIKIFPKRKEYSEVAVDTEIDFSVSPEGLAAREDVTFKLLGREKVGEYECLKVEAAYKDERQNF